MPRRTFHQQAGFQFNGARSSCDDMRRVRNTPTTSSFAFLARQVVAPRHGPTTQGHEGHAHAIAFLVLGQRST